MFFFFCGTPPATIYPDMAMLFPLSKPWLPQTASAILPDKGSILFPQQSLPSHYIKKEITSQFLSKPSIKEA